MMSCGSVDIYVALHVFFFAKLKSCDEKKRKIKRNNIF